MTPEASRRFGHALEANSSIQRYTANAPLREALRGAMVEQPSLRQIWADVDALLAGCARMRDWEHPVALADLVGFVGGDLKVWQGRLAEGLRLGQDEAVKLDQQIAENLRRLGYEFGRFSRHQTFAASTRVLCPQVHLVRQSVPGSLLTVEYL